MVNQIKKSIEQLVNNDEVYIYNVEYVKESNNNILRVTIDSNSKEVDLDMCVAVTNIINDYLDEADPISEEYFLEVSSRGAEEEISTIEELASALNQVIYVDVKEQVDNFTSFNGKLLEVNDHSILIECNIKSVIKKFEIQLDNIYFARYSVEL